MRVHFCKTFYKMEYKLGAFEITDFTKRSMNNSFSYNSSNSIYSCYRKSIETLVQILKYCKYYYWRKVSKSWFVKRTPSQDRNSCLEVFYKNDVAKLFAKFTNIHVSEPIFIEYLWATYLTGFCSWMLTTSSNKKVILLGDVFRMLSNI